MDRQLLILDIDETLAFASEQSLVQPCDYVIGRYHVYKRPNVDRFIETVAKHFDLAVWTSASEDYAEAILKPLFPNWSVLKFVWSRERCTRRFDQESLSEYWVKDLKKVRRLGYRLERVLVIDDSPEKIERHYGNHIRVSAFVGNKDDAELNLLIPFLEHMTKIPNVRVIEKRGWRSYHVG